MNFDTLHQAVARLALKQKLNTSGNASCATFLKTGSCDRGSSCKQAHCPPFVLDRLQGSDTSVLGGYLIYLTNISKNPQFRAKKVPSDSLYEALAAALDAVNAYGVEGRWRNDSYGEVFVLIHDAVFNFTQLVTKFEKELLKSGRKRKNDRASTASGIHRVFSMIVAAAGRLTNAWLEEEGVKMQQADSCALNDCTCSSNQALAELIEGEAKGLLGELSASYTDRREIIELLSREFHRSKYLTQCSSSIGGLPTKLTLIPFGSTCSGFGFGQSDLDLVLLVGDEYHDAVRSFRSLADHHSRRRADGEVGSVNAAAVLQECCLVAEASGQFQVTMLVESTRVPVLKLRHIVSDLEVDICVNNAFPLYNTPMLRQYALKDHRVRYLVFAVKLWAKRRGVSDPHNSSFSSYTWVLLVVYFLQQHRRSAAGAGPLLSVIRPEEIKADVLESSLAQVFDSLVMDDSCGPTSDGIGNVAALLVHFFAFYATESVHGFRGSRNTLVFEPPVYDDNQLRVAPVRACVRTKQHRRRHRAGAAGAAGVSVAGGSESDSDSGSDGDDDAGAGEKAAPVDSGDRRSDPCQVANNASTPWRFAVEDPLDLHDLGQVLYHREGLQNMLNELRRAYDVLLGAGAGADIWEQFCEKKENAPVFPYLCRHCNGEHSSNECPVFACFVCHKPGHFGRDCPRRRGGGAGGKPPVRAGSGSANGALRQTAAKAQGGGKARPVSATVVPATSQGSLKPQNKPKPEPKSKSNKPKPKPEKKAPVPAEGAGAAEAQAQAQVSDAAKAMSKPKPNKPKQKPKQSSSSEDGSGGQVKAGAAGGSVQSAVSATLRARLTESLQSQR